MSDWKVSEWFDYAKYLTRSIGGDVEDKVLVVHVMEHMKKIFWKGYEEGVRDEQNEEKPLA